MRVHVFTILNFYVLPFSRQAIRPQHPTALLEHLQLQQSLRSSTLSAHFPISLAFSHSLSLSLELVATDQVHGKIQLQRLSLSFCLSVFFPLILFLSMFFSLSLSLLSPLSPVFQSSHNLFSSSDSSQFFSFFSFSFTLSCTPQPHCYSHSLSRPLP